jgi:hypothetical protein
MKKLDTPLLPATELPQQPNAPHLNFDASQLVETYSQSELTSISRQLTSISR